MEKDDNNSLDFAKVILKRRLSIFVIMVLAATIGILFCVLPKKVYLVDTLIEVGTYPAGEEENLMPIENPHQLTERIASGSYDDAIKTRLSIPASVHIDIKADNPGETNLVHPYIQSTNPTKDIRILEEINALVLADHKKRSEQRLLITPVGIVETEIAKEPTISHKPLNNRPVLVMFFALFIGFVFSLFWIFAKEWWQKSVGK